MKNIVFILMEGAHDCAFLNRILKANGFKTHHKKIKEYPAPFDIFLQKSIEKTSVLELNISQASSTFTPQFIMRYNGTDSLLFIYATGGDSQVDRRIQLINQLKELTPKADEDAIIVSELSKANISVMYFLDADDKGQDKRVKQIQEELKKTKLNIQDDTVFATYPYKTDNLNIGYYIFRNDEDKGALEDILIPLMQKDNDDIFKSPEDFLNKKTGFNLFKERTTIPKKEKFNKNKSIIGAIGQLQFSGKSNTECIRYSNCLNNTKILENSDCQDIANAVLKMITN